MRQIAFLITALVLLIGIGLVGFGGKDLILEFVRRPFLARAEGEIVEFEIHRKFEGNPSDGRIHEFFVGYPKISFRTEAGETIVFTSRMGTQLANRAAFDIRTGSKITVVYDPAKWLAPTIDSPLINLSAWFYAALGLTLTCVSGGVFQTLRRSRNRFFEPL
ncbi:MAG TPA: DUF3592 domain-containing protein [Pyrinomonadaceae bacterium]|nr:DUF3592 domain-containing protein [Pyrinomonadaceae bacterium]